MFKLKKENFNNRQRWTDMVIAVILMTVIFSVPLAQAVTVSAGYHIQGQGGGGSPPPAPPTPPPTPPSAPPVISNIAVSDITSNSARITWDTDSQSTSEVNYAVTIQYDTTTTVAGFVTAHSVSLSGLLPSTTYHFEVRSTDALSNESVSADQTFTTQAPDITPPTISNITVTQITGSSAVITWSTNEPASGKIDYGLTLGYGATATSGTLDLTKSLPITGLNSETDYHFIVTATDAANNSSVSADQTFRTRDITPPIISNLAVSNITTTGATVSWNTNELSAAMLTFSAIGKVHSGNLSDPTLTTNPSLLLSALLPNTTYQLTVKSTDASGNSTTAAPIQFQTLPDTVPPANVRDLALTAGDSAITLTWSNPTDVDFSGVKILRKISGFPGSATDGTVVFTGNATSHIDLNLTNGVTYYYGVFAYDTSDNFASGAIISGSPLTTGELPPPPPGEQPPGVLITPPTTTVASTTPIVIVPEKLNNPTFVRTTIEQVQLWLANRTLAVPQDQAAEVHSLPGSSLGISVDSTSTIPVASMMVSLGGNAYLLRHDANNTYQGDFVLPSSPGLYPTKILVTYADGKAEAIQFALVIDPFGKISSTVGNKSMPLDQATVTLIEIKNGNTAPFSADQFNQVNPSKIGESGTYGFIVPAGTYLLRVEHDGYRSFESNPFEIKNFVVNQSVELLQLPKTVIDAIPFAAKVAVEQVGQFIKNQDVQNINTIVAPTITTVATINTVAAASVVNFGQYLWYLLTQPIILLRRRKYRKWGVVYDAVKKLPVDLALVRLYEQYQMANDPTERWRLVATQVTDKQGRYLFLTKPGTYRIQVAKANYIFPTAFLTGLSEDRGFLDLYHGAPFTVTEEKVLTQSIPLDSTTKVYAGKKFDWRELFKGLQNGISFGGIVLMGGSYVISPHWQNLLLVVGNLGLFVLFSRLAKQRKPKNWGRILDLAGRPVGNAVVRLFDQQFNKLVATVTTDAKGRYSFLAGPNSYYMIVDSIGFETEQTPVFDLGKTTEKIVTKDVRIKKIE